LAVIHDTIDDPGQRELVQAALQRAPALAQMACAVLLGLRRQLVGPYTEWAIPGGPAWWTALARSFGISGDQRDAASGIAQVARVYRGASRIIQSPDCVITKLSEGWGYAPLGAPMAPYQYEIQVGPDFLSGGAGDYSQVSNSCPTPNDTGILRATTLIHEAVHWHNSIRGHSSIGIRRDPYNYESFIFEIYCLPPASTIDDYRRDPVAAGDHGSTGFGPSRIVGRFRRPGPVGLG
jgi:hypothetical protein